MRTARAECLSPFKIPASYNYIACFLTLACNLRCRYCINNFGGVKTFRRRALSGSDWVRGLNRIESGRDLPVTLQGGEPSLHPDFIRIINGLKRTLQIDILTNLSFDVEEFIGNVRPSRLRRDAPYPNIRVSYHPGLMGLRSLARKVLKMQEAGFSIGISGILHPTFRKEIMRAQKVCQGMGLDFRTKEFLGTYGGRLYGTYRYRFALNKARTGSASCRTSELIIAPDGSIYRCHHDLYRGLFPIGHLLDPSFRLKDVFRECRSLGQCNPCDVKTKMDRFQVWGHTAVEIKRRGRAK